MREDDLLEPIATDPPTSDVPSRSRARFGWPALIAVALLAAVAGGVAGGAAAAWRLADEQDRVDARLRILASNVRRATSPDVIVPDVSGLARREAVAILDVAGLETFDDPTLPAPSAIVLGQIPAAGTVVDHGDGVQLSTRPGPHVLTGAVEATGTAMDLARRTGCDLPESLADPDPDPESRPGVPRPRTAAECRFGEAHFAIRTFDSEADVTAVLEADGAFCGHRTVGRSWIASVNTENTAWRIQNALGGRVVQFTGC